MSSAPLTLTERNMCDQDEVQRILQKTRAQRERLNRHLVDIGECR